MDCDFKVVEQVEKSDHTKIRVKADCFEKNSGKWFSFTDKQVKNGRWKKHVEKQVEMIRENSSEKDIDLIGEY